MAPILNQPILNYSGFSIPLPKIITANISDYMVTNGRDLPQHVSNNDRTLKHRNGNKGIAIIVPLLRAGM